MRKEILSILIVAVIVLGVILYFAWAMPSAPSFPAPNTQPSSASSSSTNLMISGGQPTLPTTTVTIGNTTIHAEVASTDTERDDGLSGRSGLAPGQGMLFVFPQPQNDGFWMKEMNFSLDILYADANGTIVTIWPNLSPSTYPQAFYPISPAQYVLELPANFAAQNGIVVGSKMVIQ